MDESVSGAELAQRLRDGDPKAAEEIFSRYAGRLTRLAQQHLGRKLAGRLDAEDVVQSVFRSFFRRNAGGQFQIGSSVQMWRLLVKITLMKARAKARYHMAEMRDVGAEAPGGEEAWLPEALAGEPGPDEAVALVDLIDALLRGLPAIYRDVLEMRLADYSVIEIAAKLGVSRQTVYRAFDLLQDRLGELSGSS